MDILKILLDIDEELLDWILETKADTPEQKALMRRVMVLRGRVEGQINEVVRIRVALSVKDLSKHTADLEKLRKRIEETTNDIDTVAQVISIAGQVVTVAAEVIALAA